MGNFSWMKADDLTTVANIVEKVPFKCLIPIEFGGGFIKDNYQGYGRIGHKEDGSPKYDMYELLAFWNSDAMCEGRLVKDQLIWPGGPMPTLKEIDEHTTNNRNIGIDIGCYDHQIDRLKYPLKLVSASFKGCYEDLDKPSYNDPNQGYWRIRR